MTVFSKLGVNFPPEERNHSREEWFATYHKVRQMLRVVRPMLVTLEQRRTVAKAFTTALAVATHDAPASRLVYRAVNARGFLNFGYRV